MNEKKIKEKLGEFFKTHSDYFPEYDENLFESGALDSFGVVEFLTFIEESFKVRINLEDITMENFKNINKICTLILMNK